MTEFTNKNGETVTVERNADGSYTASGSDGGSTTYGANDAPEHLATDWGLDGTGFDLGDVGGPDPSPSDPSPSDPSPSDPSPSDPGPSDPSPSDPSPSDPGPSDPGGGDPGGGDGGPE